MNNLLKKHSKTIFAVLGAFLMLTFTLPSVLKNNGDVSNVEVGRLDGKKVTNGSIQSASSDINVLARYGLLGSFNAHLPSNISMSPGILTIGPAPNPYGMQLYKNVPIAYLSEAGGTTHDTERGTHWFLLFTEAQKLGLLADPAEISGWASSVEVDHDKLIQLLYKDNITESQFRGAIAQAIMIRNLAQHTMQGFPPSVPGIELLATENLATVSVDYAALDATKDFAKFPEPTADQIQKQFDTYKSVLATYPGSSTKPATIDGHEYPFGYKYPDRVKVEYLKFDRAELAKQYKPTHDDIVEAFRYYNAHPEDELIATTQPGVRKSFDDVREKLVQRQVDDRINKFLKRITDRVASITAVPWTNAKDVNGFREAIPRSEWVDYKSIPNSLKSTPEFSNYQPEYDVIDSFQSARQLAAVPGIGSASFDHQGAPLAFAVLATHVHELGDFPDFPHLYLQAGIDGPILKDDAGNLYIYRITEADKAHDPASLDEVRAQVVDDLKKVANFQQQQKDAKAIAELATTGSFTSVAKSKGLTVTTTSEFRHSDPEIPGLGPVPGFADAAFDLARGDSATSQPDSQPAVSSTLNRATTLPDEADLKVYVLALTTYKPVTPAGFAEKRKDLVNYLAQETGVDFANEWLSFDNTLKRDKYVPSHPFNTK